MTANRSQRPDPDLRTFSPSFDSYLRDHAGQEVGVLGFVALLSVGKVDTVTHEDLVSWFAELDLQPQHLPNPPRPADAFERATSNAKIKYPINRYGRRTQHHERTGQTVTLMMRHVARDESRIVRHLVRELVDHADEALSYEVKLAEATFVRTISSNLPMGSGTMNLSPVDSEITKLPTFERTQINDLIRKITADYDHACRYIPSTKVSGMLRTYLENRCGAVRLQNGVYFVPWRYNETLGALRDLATRCGAQLNRIPLPDTADQRGMVQQAFTSKTTADLDSLARDIAREQTNGAAAYRVSKLHARFLEIQREAAEYQANLGDELGDTQARLDLINAQMATLLMSVNNGVSEDFDETAP